jgi:hypothetical protein
MTLRNDFLLFLDSKIEEARKELHVYSNGRYFENSPLFESLLSAFERAIIVDSEEKSDYQR